VPDSLSGLEKRVPAFVGKMDAEPIGVSGHSMGAFTADAIAGALVDLPGHPAMNFGERRVRAVLRLSPQRPGERAAEGDSILGYTNGASLAFWDVYLKADPAARSICNPTLCLNAVTAS
jgi:hypothetical protein